MSLPRLAVFALAAALLSACGTGAPSTAGGPSSAPSSSTPRSPGSTLPPGVDQLVTVTVRAGEVLGGARRILVGRGDVVRLLVTSDVSDEVHLHTYDQRAHVAAGGTAVLTFTADIPGVIAAELEAAGLVLVRFQVQ